MSIRDLLCGRPLRTEEEQTDVEGPLQLADPSPPMVLDAAMGMRVAR